MKYIEKRNQALNYEEIATIALAGNWDDSEKKLMEIPEVTDIKLENRLYIVQAKSPYPWQGPTIPWTGYLYPYLIEEAEMKFKTSEAIYIFRDFIKEIKSVFRIAYSSTGRIVTIWTFLKDYNRKSLYKVYDVEKNVIERYPSITFDFTTLVSTAEPIPSGFIVEEFHNVKSQ